MIQREFFFVGNIPYNKPRALDTSESRFQWVSVLKKSGEVAFCNNKICNVTKMEIIIQRILPQHLKFALKLINLHLSFVLDIFSSYRQHETVPRTILDNVNLVGVSKVNRKYIFYVRF